MNQRRLRRLGRILAVCAVAALATTTTSRASTQLSAQLKATKIQKNDCKWGNPALYSCEHPYFLLPQCIPTHVNQPAHAQWICGGVFVRKQRLSGKIQFCYTTYYLSPWNKELYGSGYTCYGSLLSSGDSSRTRR